MLSGEAVNLPEQTAPVYSVNFPGEVVMKFTYTNGKPKFSHSGKMTDFKDCSLVRLKTHTIQLCSKQVF